MRLIRLFHFSWVLVLSGWLCARAERVVLVAGGGAEVTGAATNCQLRVPFGVDFGRAGEMYIVEMAEGERVLKVDQASVLSVIGGTGAKGDSGDGGPAIQAVFNGMHSLAMGPAETMFLADTWNNRVRTLDLTSGKVRPFAGTGEKGFSGDRGSALTARFGGIYCVAFDRAKENLYLADLDNRRIRKVNLRDGIVSAVAGNGARGVPVDGRLAVHEPLVDPRAVAVDSQGQVYVLERGGHALRVVDLEGKIRTVAGTGAAGFEGDGGNALQAKLRGPKHLCVDASDNVIIADTDNHVIRKYVAKEHRLLRVAGSGRKGTNGVGGSPLELELNQPHGVTVAPDGALFIVDSWNHRVLKIER